MRKLSSLAFAILILSGGALSAHEGMPVERSAIAQIHADRVEILLMYSEPPGPRSEALLGRYDIDGDGRIDGDKETALALPEVSKRIALGLEFEVDGERPFMQPPALKITRDRSGGLAAALYLTYRLDQLTAGNRTLQIRVSDRDGVVPLNIIVEAGEGLSIVETDMPHDGRETRPVTMPPGTDFSVRVAPQAAGTGTPPDSAGAEASP